jgi:hypothetical protein
MRLITFVHGFSLSQCVVDDHALPLSRSGSLTLKCLVCDSTHILPSVNLIVSVSDTLSFYIMYNMLITYLPSIVSWLESHWYFYALSQVLYFHFLYLSVRQQLSCQLSNWTFYVPPLVECWLHYLNPCLTQNPELDRELASSSHKIIIMKYNHSSYLMFSLNSSVSEITKVWKLFHLYTKRVMRCVRGYEGVTHLYKREQWDVS